MMKAVVVLAFVCSVAVASEQKCTCKTQNGDIIDISSLGFKNGTARTSMVACNCDPSAEVPRFNVTGELSIGNYFFSLTSKCCCPGVCSGSANPVEKCTGTNGCFCKTKDGLAIDLSTIGYRDGTARFTHIPGPDGFLYSYNPCYPFNQLNCINSAACQEDRNQFVSYSIGDYSTAEFYYDDKKKENHIMYRAPGPGSGTNSRVTDVTLVCDMDAAEPILEIVGETHPLIYNMTLTTKCACPNGCEADLKRP